ncbi:MAG TPA: Gfo/Idh/MocA family oxidoreductase [Candidatus Avipropionibacterium avicola]|uniref:Gfo/Idh/MocA family oxidoreductase n=1 Tax=Candidatus Avipropionibacterium avicola TaxID=2840701 RepID=A0A9D1GXB5_9ACTN|nr:Gfo/Idh/MocA family oxidoreductase [Candidatus Avipropionibacterium avicola]
MVNVAVIGCGNLGRAHARALAGMAEVDVSHLCDPVVASARELGQEPGLTSARIGAEADAVWSDEQVEAVWITTPNNTHLELATAAVRAGKHVFIEKPMATTMSDCAAILDLAHDSDRLVMPGYKLRFFPMVELARQLVPEPISLHVQVLDGRWPDRGWVNDPQVGGGNIVSQGCHGTDLIRHLAGQDPRQVYAVGGQFYSDRVWTNLSAVYRFDADVSATLSVGDAALPAVTSKFFAQVIGDGIAVTLNDRLTRLTVQRPGEEPEVHTGPEIEWTVEDEAFLTAIRTGSSAPVDALDGWWATAMTESAIHSAQERNPIDLVAPR